MSGMVVVWVGWWWGECDWGGIVVIVLDICVYTCVCTTHFTHPLYTHTCNRMHSLTHPISFTSHPPLCPHLGVWLEGR